MAKKTVDTALVASAMEIAHELREIGEALEASGGEITDEQFVALKAWNMAFENKAENIALYKCNRESQIEYYKQLEEAARAKRKSLENAIAGLKRYLVNCMMEAGIKSVKKKDGLFSISLVDGRPSVRIDNPGALPCALVEIVETIKPRTDEIKRRLDAGEEVPGASIEIGAPYVMIR